PFLGALLFIKASSTSLSVSVFTKYMIVLLPTHNVWVMPGSLINGVGFLLEESQGMDCTS
ncbi:hypothetical protein OVY35_24680, partial [Salmonella enterica subsp. enterica serovar 1,4,[5],12:i:-]|nr:hypothetical protein [Salmonella enterica subsp. enterica serovar 1,4,[5],12:i:-]